jgi:AGCS family alanine or glycine:cation symporter
MAYGEDVTRTASAAFSSVLGEWAGGFFALSILLFGVATVVCWAHYGMNCVQYLFGGERRRRISEGIYVIMLAASLTVGSVTAPTLAWTVADAAIAVMTLLNLTVLVLMRREVKAETQVLLSIVRPRKSCIFCKENQAERSHL